MASSWFLYFEIAWVAFFFLYFLVRLKKGLSICSEELPKQFSKAIIVIIALVSILFSVHSSIYSQYDEIDEKGKYFWGNLSHLNEFPIDQLQLNNKINCSELKLDINEIADDHCYYFLIDKTKSTYPDQRLLEISKHLRNELQTSLSGHENACLNPVILPGDLSISDLIVLSFIQKLYKNPDINLNKSFVVYFYMGDSSCPSVFDKKTVVGKTNFCDVVKEYLSKIELCNKVGKNSDFKYVFDELNKPNSLGNVQEGNKSLSILSDFIHDFPASGPSYIEVENTIREFSQKNISQVNLINVTGRYANAESANIINSILRKHFSEVYLYKYVDQELMMNEKISESIYYIFSRTKKDTTQSVKMYYPYSYGKLSASCVGALKSKQKNESDKFIFSLRNETDISTNGTQISFKSPDKIIFIDKPEYYEMNPGKEKILTGRNFLNSSNYFFEMQPVNSFSKYQVPIIFFEKLPRSICHLLIILFLAFFIGVFFIGMYTLCRYSKEFAGGETLLEAIIIYLNLILHPLVTGYLIFQCVFGFMNKETIWPIIFFVSLFGVFVFTGIKFWIHSLKHKKP